MEIKMRGSDLSDQISICLNLTALNNKVTCQNTLKSANAEIIDLRIASKHKELREKLCHDIRRYGLRRRLETLMCMVGDNYGSDRVTVNEDVYTFLFSNIEDRFGPRGLHKP